MTVHEVYEKYVKPLSAEERRELDELMHRSETEEHPTRRKPHSLLELRGSVPYPMMGEDAQAWVTRTRAESDEERGF
jgi:hypothetical protein